MNSATQTAVLFLIAQIIYKFEFKLKSNFNYSIELSILNLKVYFKLFKFKFSYFDALIDQTDPKFKVQKMTKKSATIA